MMDNFQGTLLEDESLVIVFLQCLPNKSVPQRNLNWTNINKFFSLSTGFLFFLIEVIYIAILSEVWIQGI